MRRFLFPAVVFCFIFAACAACFASERILDYSQYVSVQKNSDIQVKEVIKFNVENVNIIHGIVRSFPVVRTDADGRRRRVGFEFSKAFIDGAEVPFSSEFSGNACNVRIGSREVFIPAGVHFFTLLYRVSGEIGFFDDHDELYWNVTGSEWKFPIDRASCHVQLPGKNFGEGFTAVEWYVGGYGLKGEKNDARLTEANSVQTSRALREGEGLTVVFGWNKGLVEQPPLPREDDPRTHAAVGICVFIAMLGWLVYAWNRWGRDPVKAVIPLFHAPEGISPAALKYAQELAFDDKTLLSSDIVDLAVKGALTIEQTGGERKLIFRTPVSYILHKTGSVPDSLTADERVLLDILFAGGDTVDLSDDVSPEFYTAKLNVEASCRETLGKLYDSNSAPFSVAALIYAAGVALLYFKSKEAFPLDMFACGAGGAVMFMSAMQKENRLGKFGAAVFVRRIFVQLVFALIGSFILVSLGNNPLPFALFCASVCAVSVFRPLMAARNERGAEIFAQAEGLKMYITAAEKDRLEMLAPPEETPQLFEELLPYALAFGAAKTWADRFSGVFADTGYQPQWCTGGAGWMPYDFTGSFARSVHSAATPSVQSGNSGNFGGNWDSGLGGGGFSGGGGGGGGGSGW